MNKFNVIIPARMHSSRLPQKMVMDVAGLPLVIRTAKQAQKSGASCVVVATDHNDIRDLCNKHSVEVVMTATTHHNGTDRIKEAVAILGFEPTDIVVNVQGDEPLIEPKVIDQLAKFTHDNNSEMATIAHPITDINEVFNHNIVKVVLDKAKNALYFSRSAIPFYREGFSVPDNFKLPLELNMLRHVGIYAYRVDFIKRYNELELSELEQVEALEQLRALYNGHKIAVCVIESLPTPGVDTLSDLNKVRQMLGQIK